MSIRNKGLDKFYTIPEYSKKCIDKVFDFYDKDSYKNTRTHKANKTTKTIKKKKIVKQKKKTLKKTKPLIYGGNKKRKIMKKTMKITAK